MARHGRLFNRPTIISMASSKMGGKRRGSKKRGSKRVAANRYIVANRRRSSRRLSTKKSAVAARRRRRALRAAKAAGVKKTSRRRSSRKGSRKGSRRKGSRRLSTKKSAVAARRRRRALRAAGKKTSRKKSSRKKSSRRRRGSKMAANRRRRSSRRGVRRNSRRRSSRRMRRNVLTQRIRRTKKGLRTVGGPGSLYQVVEYGPKKTKSGRRRGYPVGIPASISTHASIRRFKFGGIAKRRHEAKRGSMAANRRRSSRRRGTRRNPRYVVMNRRRGRRMRKNFMVGGMDLVKGIAIPGVSVLGGVVAVRALAAFASRTDMVKNLLDRDVAPEMAWKTRVAANVAGIGGAIAIGAWRGAAPYRATIGWAVAGMSASLAGMALARIFPAQPWAQALAGGMGEYVDQPLGGMRYATAGFGEYVDQPLGAYVSDPSAGMGEYVDQPLGGVQYATAGLGSLYAAAGYPNGIDPSDQNAIDGLMDVMEAAAGTPSEQAAAGVGALYAAAGMGQEADADLQAMYAAEQPPFVSTQTPTDVALRITREMPNTLPVKRSLVTREARANGGYADGIFGGTLFGGMKGE